MPQPTNGLEPRRYEIPDALCDHCRRNRPLRSLDTSAAVLDYGCGEALHADRIGAVAGRLMLAEAAPGVRARLVERFKKNPKITVVSAERAATMPDRSFDFVVLHSVSQYLSNDEFDRVQPLLPPA